jgi:hypothetical protein
MPPDAWSVLVAAQDGQSELTGLAGLITDIIAALGPIGVGALVALETVFPPIPSELVLPLSGYLASRGRMSLAAVVIGATLLGRCRPGPETAPAARRADSPGRGG